MIEGRVCEQEWRQGDSLKAMSNGPNEESWSLGQHGGQEDGEMWTT